MSKIAVFDVLDRDFQNNPYPIYGELHQDDLVYFDKNFGAYFIGKYADVSRILNDPVFTTAPLAVRAQPVMGDRVLAQMEGTEHAQKRRTVLRGLGGSYFHNTYAPLIETITRQLIAPLISRGGFDLVRDFGKDYAVLVTLGILDLPATNHRLVGQWHAGVADFVTRLDMTECERRHSLECSRHLSEFLTPIISDRLQTPGRDLISLLCLRDDNGDGMTVSEIVALCLNILLAATEPADKSLAMLFKHLIDHPNALQAVRQDKSLLRGAIEETLRLTSPVQLIPREASQDTEISGVPITKGSLVFSMIGAANRDPSIFEGPNLFELKRFSPASRPDRKRGPRHLAFGAGMHVCLGAEFSLRQIEITGSILLDELTDLRMPGGFQLEERGLYTRGPVSLPIEFSPISTGHARTRTSPEERNE